MPRDHGAEIIARSAGARTAPLPAMRRMMDRQADPGRASWRDNRPCSGHSSALRFDVATALQAERSLELTKDTELGRINHFSKGVQRK